MNKKQQIFLSTKRLCLRTPAQNDLPSLRAFESRNLQSPWRTAAGPHLEDQLVKWHQELEENRAIRFLLFFPGEQEVIGLCNFSQIFRGPFQACYLGYQIDAAHEGKGLMSEAVWRGIQYMFEEERLHRIMANYMPSNRRSARLLEKLGFVIEGLAKKYLLINGQWEDHVLTSLTHPNY